MSNRKGPQPPRANTAHAFWTGEPRITRGEAGEILGTEISASVWAQIELALERMVEGVGLLAATRVNKDKNDERGWKTNLDATSRDLLASMTALSKVLTRRDFLEEAQEMYGFATGDLEIESQHRALLGAHAALMRAYTVVTRAQPIRRDALSSPALERRFVREVHAALAAVGLPARASFGEDLNQLLDPLQSMTVEVLTPFERFLWALGVHEAANPYAFSKWVREALAGQT